MLISPENQINPQLINMHLRRSYLTSSIGRPTLTPPPPITTEADTNGVIQVVSTAIIIVMAAIFVTTSIFFCFCRSITNGGCCGADDHDNNQHNGGDGEGRRRRTPAGITRAVIETFPTYLYSDVKVHRLGNGELECAVCLNEFKDVEILRLLPTCCHVFHPDCIDTWLITRPTCPVCRADVGSVSNLTEHGNLRNLLGTSSEGDHSSEEQLDVVQIRIATPEAMRITRIQENHLKSHSTGHSPVWTAEETNRFTLRLPEEVRNKLVNGGNRFTLMSSPRSWYRQRSNRNKNYYNRFKTGNMLGRLGKQVEPSNVIGFGSPKSDGPVDYSTLVNGRNNLG